MIKKVRILGYTISIYYGTLKGRVSQASGLGAPGSRLWARILARRWKFYSLGLTGQALV